MLPLYSNPTVFNLLLTLSLVSGFFSLSTASAQDASRRIARIDIIRKNVFDPDRPEERHAFASLVNSLHVLTREEVIRRELLFREVDVFDEFLLLESARNLRARGFVGDIQTEVEAFGDSAVVITVTTQDKWTIDLLPSYKQEGGSRPIDSRSKTTISSGEHKA